MTRLAMRLRPQESDVARPFECYNMVLLIFMLKVWFQNSIIYC